MNSHGNIIIKGILRWFASLGVGLIPGAHGTYGSILTFLLVWAWLANGGDALTGAGYLLFMAGFVPLSWLITHLSLKLNAFVRSTDPKDPPQLVIDEALGLVVALYGAQAGDWAAMLTGLVFFRIFDIFKPFPVNKAEGLPGAWGVLADDVVAGVMALVGVKLVFSWVPLIWA